MVLKLYYRTHYIVNFVNMSLIKYLQSTFASVERKKILSLIHGFLHIHVVIYVIVSFHAGICVMNVVILENVHLVHV